MAGQHWERVWPCCCRVSKAGTGLWLLTSALTCPADPSAAGAHNVCHVPPSAGSVGGRSHNSVMSPPPALVLCLLSTSTILVVVHSNVPLQSLCTDYIFSFCCALVVFLLSSSPHRVSLLAAPTPLCSPAPLATVFLFVEVHSKNRPGYPPSAITRWIDRFSSTDHRVPTSCGSRH